MILLVDLNQIVISSLMAQIGADKKMEVSEGLLRHMILNNLRACVKQFKSEYPEVVICCDNKKYWRREYFPFYKANRKKTRDNQVLVDWKLVFDTLDKVKLELKEYLPYKVLDVEGAEADDVIATLTKLKAPHGKVLIVSNDKDFVQLQRFPNVRQYGNLFKKYIKSDDPVRNLKEHIIRGDRGDGVPNILSPDDSFVTGQRQKPINSKKVDIWVNQDPGDFCQSDSMLRWYKRNEVLIDLTKIPESLTETIVKAYNEVQSGSKKEMLNYFIAYRLTSLIGGLDEF